MSERFFSEKPLLSRQTRLEGSEAQHAVKVMRVKVRDEIVLFDGSGSEFVGQVMAITSRGLVEIDSLERREVNRELARDVTLAVALPKGDRQQWLVEKLTELGVTRLVPIICRRSVAQPVESALARLQRWVIEASKQCGRNRLMEIAPPAAWTNYLAQPSVALRVIAHPGPYQAAELFTTAAAEIIAAVGPEGGWTDEEVDAALAAGWQGMSLGPRILRVETAAIALASLASLGERRS